MRPRNHWGASWYEVGCLQCAHCKLKPPGPDWQKTACPDHHATRQCDFDGRHAVEYIRKTKRNIPIICTLYPEWREYHSGHYCGQFEANNPSSLKSLQSYLWGTGEEREITALREDNERLKRDLKAVRERSAARLKRLKKLQANGQDAIPQ